VSDRPYTVVRDTREQRGWFFRPMVERALRCGDYTIKELDKYLRIERKGSFGELAGNLGRKVLRARFEREMEAMQGFPLRLLVVEENPSGLDAPLPHSSIPSESVWRMLMRVQLVHRVPVLFAGHRPQSRQRVRGLLDVLWELWVKDSRLLLKEGVACPKGK